MTIIKNNEDKYTIEINQKELEEMHMWSAAQAGMLERFMGDNFSESYNEANKFFKESAKYIKDRSNREEKWGHLF